MHIPPGEQENKLTQKCHFLGRYAGSEEGITFIKPIYNWFLGPAYSTLDSFMEVMVKKL